jgi:glycosyltransferase involved in cell wall biosynthesis
MKLCYVLPQYYKNSSENFYHIANFLSELGKNVDLYVVIENSDTPPKIDNVKKIFTLNTQSVSMSILRRMFRLVRIYFELNKEGVSVFFSRSSITGVFPLVLANRFLNFNRLNIIFWSCGQDVVPISFLPKKKNIKRIISKVIASFVFKGINYLATGPELMVDYYNQHYKIPKNKILTLYNDISLSRFYPLSANEKAKNKQKIIGINKKVMLFVHTFNKSRGVDLLPLFAKRIIDNDLNIKIIAIGRPGDYSEQLNKEIKVHRLEGCLLNLGMVANKDISKYYQIADLFIMPSRGEGFPRVLLESMACACPSIAFDVGGVKNILPEEIIDELVVPLKDESKFIGQSLKIINDDACLLDFGQKSLKKVEKFSTKNIVQMYLNSLNNLK